MPVGCPRRLSVPERSDSALRTIRFDREQHAAILIDQTRLPLESVWVTCRSVEDVAEAIRSMRIRGAPAIGVAAAYGMALAAGSSGDVDAKRFLERLDASAEMLSQTRPTAVNLRWALDRCLAYARQCAPAEGVAAARRGLLDLADRMADEDVAVNQRIGQHGAKLVPARANILTHCNTGGLATVDYGTALGVIRTAHEQGRNLHIWVDETRPFLQGARLTAWELQGLGIPMTLITDNMAGHFMQRGQVDMVIVGADRVAANGDTANKIGTYSLAVLAREHGIPFYVAAPTSTVDLSLASGDEIPIEERSTREVVEIGGRRIAPKDVSAAHPAFDVTPARLITAIVTEQGVLRAPYESALRAAVEEALQTPVSAA